MTRKFERLVFHAGMPKTGTTIIQYTLKRGAPTNADLLDLGPSNQTGACRLLFDEQKEEAKYKAHRRNKPNAGLEKAGLLERLHRQFDTSCQPALILSAEWGYRAKPESLMRLKALFQPHCERIEVYIYLRRPEAFMNSVFQQRIKGSGEGFLPPWPKYREMCLKHERIFGADQVNLRVYDRDRFPKGDVVADFFDWTGLDGMQSMTLERNKSLSAAGVALMGCYRRHKPQAGIASGDPEVKWLVNRLRALKAPKLALSPGLVEKTLRRHRDELDWLEARLGQPFAEVFHAADGKQEGTGAVYFVGSEEDFRRAAAHFAPLLSGETPAEPPADPDAADAQAWAALSRFLEKRA